MTRLTQGSWKRTATGGLTLLALLAAGMTAYILIAIRYEERDLVGLFGADYHD